MLTGRSLLLMSATRYILHYDLPKSFEGMCSCLLMSTESYRFLYKAIIRRQVCQSHATVDHRITYQSLSTTGRGGRDGQACTIGSAYSIQSMSDPQLAGEVYSVLLYVVAARQSAAASVKRVADATMSQPGRMLPKCASGLMTRAGSGSSAQHPWTGPCRVSGLSTAWKP